MFILSLSRHWISLHFSKSCIFMTLLLPLPHRREVMTEVEWREAEQASWRRADQSYSPWGRACGGWLTRSPLSNTEGYGNFSVVLSSLVFSQRGDRREGGCARICGRWHLCASTCSAFCNSSHFLWFWEKKKESSFGCFQGPSVKGVQFYSGTQREVSQGPREGRLSGGK